MSPSQSLSDTIKRVVPDVLGIKYLVLAVVDAHGRSAIAKMAGSVIDGALFRTLMLGLPGLADSELVEIVRAYEGNSPPYEFLCRPEMRPVVEAVLRPSPETGAPRLPQRLRERNAAGADGDVGLPGRGSPAWRFTGRPSCRDSEPAELLSTPCITRCDGPLHQDL